jgi:hypothetical protein
MVRAMVMRGARRQGDPLLRSGRTPERTALLAPALLVAAMMSVGVGAGGIDRLASLGEIATGPAPPGEQLPGSSSQARQNAVVSALTHRAGAQRRTAAGDGGEAVGKGSSAGSAATGVADFSTPAGAAAAPISPPSSDPGGGLAGGGESPARDPVGVPDAAPPVRDRVAPIERVVDELLEDLGSQAERVPPARVPPARRKLQLRFED